MYKRQWYYNLLARDHVTIQDGPAPMDYTIRELEGEERNTWYARGEAVYPDYTAYQEAATGHGRVIPVFVATPSA